MRNLQKQFEKLLILIKFKFDNDKVLQRRMVIAMYGIIALIGSIVGYHIVYSLCWLMCNERQLFSLLFAVFGMLVWGWILYTEKR